MSWETKSIQVSRENYIKLVNMQHQIYNRLVAEGKDKGQISFDDVITQLLIGEKK